MGIQKLILKLVDLLRPIIREHSLMVGGATIAEKDFTSKNLKLSTAKKKYWTTEKTLLIERKRINI